MSCCWVSRRLFGLGVGGGRTTNAHAAPYCDMIYAKVDWGEERVERTRELEVEAEREPEHQPVGKQPPKGPKGPVARSCGGAAPKED